MTNAARSDPNPADARARAMQAEAFGDRHYQAGQFHKALAYFREAARLWPASADTHYKVAYAAWKATEFALIEPAFLEAIRLYPRHALAHEGLAIWYLNADRIDLALHHSAAALALESATPDFLVTRGFVLLAHGQPQEAWKLLEPVLNDPSVTGRAALLYVQVAPRIGREEQAIEHALRLLGNRGAAATGPDLPFALASLLDRMGRYDQAFEQATLAHRASGRRYDPDMDIVRITAQISNATAARSRALPHATHGSRRPVFIVGMPRSGTSLIEQVLACHPQVFAAGELEDLHRIALRLPEAGIGYPRSLENFTPEIVNQIAGQYLSRIGLLNRAATFVTDKMPLNFLYLDLVELLFPGSRVIHCMRDPLDTCVSCYLTQFAAGHEFAGDLRHLGTFYRQYQRLMGHWKATLSVPILDVQYEAVVADIEAEARRIVEFLGLPWDPRCLDFHRNARAITTASRAQVRQPIYASSIGRWRQYERHLAPLIDALRG